MTITICIDDINRRINKLNKDDILLIEKYLIENNLASDKDDAVTIKEKLSNPPVLNSSEFASEVIYVILASGFSQKTAKKKYFEIMNYINNLNDKKIELSDLLTIFNNKNKMSAIMNIWKNKDMLTRDYYQLNDDKNRMKFLLKLPFIGPITQNHIARNLGINTVKPDIWIVRLSNSCGYTSYHDMFDELSKLTEYPIGYLDVILWKACQIGIIRFDK